jgi:hypothetical protein
MLAHSATHLVWSDVVSLAVAAAATGGSLGPLELSRAVPGTVDVDSMGRATTGWATGRAVSGVMVIIEEGAGSGAV